MSGRRHEMATKSESVEKQTRPPAVQGASACTPSDTDAAIDGGFLLVGRSYEKDCSFRAILGMLRDSEETNVAGLLFG